MIRHPSYGRPSLRPSMRSSVPAPFSVRPPGPWEEYEARILEAPDNGTVRGMFFTEILRLAPGLRVTHKRRYLPFSKYPLRDYMQLLIDAGKSAHPTRTPEDGLRELGRTAYPTFTSSMAGIALFGGLSSNSERVLELIPKAYPLTVEPCRVELVSRGEREAVFKLRDLWTFPESYQLGVWLGGLQVLGVEGTIDVIRHSWCSVDFHVHWRLRE